MAFTPTTAKPDPYCWKRFRWRLATPEQLQHASTLVSLAWSWLTASIAAPDTYVAAAHHYCAQFIPLKQDPLTVLYELGDIRPPYDIDMMSKIDKALSAQVHEPEYGH